MQDQRCHAGSHGYGVLQFCCESSRKHQGAKADFKNGPREFGKQKSMESGSENLGMLMLNVPMRE